MSSKKKNETCGIPSLESLGKVEETKEKKDIYSIAWSEVHEEKTVHMASCSGRNLLLYRQEVPDGAQRSSGQQASSNYQLKLEYSYRDADSSEDYYACVFAGRTQLRPFVPKQQPQAKAIAKLPPEWESILTKCKGPQLVCVGGEQGVIQVIDTVRQQSIQTLMGHGGAIYDLKVSPVDEWLLLSASRDESCRLWSLRTGSAVAVFGGHEGHRDAVISVAWHKSGQQFASAGVDTRVKLWEITANVENAIAANHEIANEIEASRGQQEERYLSGSPVLEQYPVFSSNKIHVHLVDCVEYVGDLLVSKSTQNTVKLWCPKIERETSTLGYPTVPPPSDIVLLRSFVLKDCDEIWFVRFAMDPSKQILAAGNTQGIVYLWNIGSRTRKPHKLRIRRSCTIRYLSFSPDGNVLVASTNDGCIYCWNVSELDDDSQKS